MLVRVFHHNDGGIGHFRNRQRNTGQTHDIGIDAKLRHGDKSNQYADRQHDDRHQRATHMHEEYHANQRHDDDLLDKHFFQCRNGAVNQFGTVVNRFNRNILRQAGFDLVNFCFEIMNHIQRILTIARYRDAGNNFAFAIQFSNAAALTGNQFHTGNIAQQYRHTGMRPDHQILQIASTLQVTVAAHHIFRFGQFNDAPADITIAGGDDFGDPFQRNVIRLQAARIDRDLVGFDKPADTGDFRYAGHGG